MQLAVSALHFEWATLAGCFDRVRDEFGLDGVELSWNRSYARPHCTEADMVALRELRSSHRLALSVHIWENLCQLGQDKGVEALRAWLDMCPDTGVEALVLHGGTWPDQGEGVRRTRDVLWAVAPEAAATGVTLLLENHYAFDYRGCNELFSQPWEFREVFADGVPGLGFCFDTGHGHMTRNWQDLLTGLAPSLRYIHLAGNHGEHDDHCAFREGTVPWDGIFDCLQEIAFDGTFCVEFPVREDLGPFRACLAELRRRFGA